MVDIANGMLQAIICVTKSGHIIACYGTVRFKNPHPNLNDRFQLTNTIADMASQKHSLATYAKCVELSQTMVKTTANPMQSWKT